MTYWGVLLRFLVPPLVFVLLIELVAFRTNKSQDQSLRLQPYAIVLLHVLIAVAYTTPWDNYLVAQAIWWYDPELVSGVVLGYVPIEEYSFFVLQTLMTGTLTLLLLRWDGAHKREDLNKRSHRIVISLLVLAIGLLGLAMLIMGWDPGRYLALILVWAAPPILIQTLFGGDILLAHWRTLLSGVTLPTLYLWWVDSLAIGAGTWTISNQFTTGLKLGLLPVEEMTFFFVTNWIVVVGVLLMLSPASQKRARDWQRKFAAVLHTRGSRDG
jgi:putative membrane protein